MEGVVVTDTTANFKDEGRSHKPRDARNAALESRKGRKGIPPVVSQGHLDFSETVPDF